MTAAPISVCLAGATGWAGSELARAIAAQDDLALVAAVSRTHAGSLLGHVLAEPGLVAPVFATAREALAHECDVFVEYTKPSSAKENVLAALERGAHVVIGTSGLGDDDYREIDRQARERGRAVLAVGNFALTVVLLQKFAEMAARVIPQWEIIDTHTTTSPTRRAARCASSRTGSPGCEAPSPPSRSARRSGSRPRAARPYPARRCTRSGCRAT